MPEFPADPRIRPEPQAERILPLPSRERAAARTWLEDGAEGACCVARTAAAVVCVREGRAGLETFLTSRTAPDTPLGRVGFPSGPVVPEDQEPMGWYGPTPHQWAQKLGHEDVTRARSAVVAAVRCGFEEAGVLLAGRDDISTAETTAGADLMAAREKVSGRELPFSQYLHRSGLRLRTDLLRPLGRWLTPDFSHRRYDTHYFAAVVPVGQHPALLGSRGVWGRWASARELLADPSSTALAEEIGLPGASELPLSALVTPGVLTVLESLAESQTAIGYLTKKRAVQVNQARLVDRGGELALAFSSPQDRCRARAKGD